MKKKFLFIYFSIFFILFFLLSITIFSQESLISLEDFQKLSKDKKISYLKEAITKNLYELKLIYYITLSEKPLEIFSIWENSIIKAPQPSEEELKLKRSQTLLIIFTFQSKLSYLERNVSLLERNQITSDEIAFIKSIYYFYYKFENSKDYLDSKEFILNFFLKNKMIAHFFMNFSNLDKLQILITNNFDQFIEIFTDEFLMNKIKTIRSEELKKEFIKKIIQKKPSFISSQLKSLLMGSSNDFNSFLINEIALNHNKFNNSDKQNIKNELQKILQQNFSQIIHKAIYYYFSNVEPKLYIEQFRNFYKKESNIIKKELIYYLLQIKDLSIYRTILLTYLSETDSWMRDKIFEQIDVHTDSHIPSDMALEFLNQFQQLHEDRFIIIKSKFLFYLEEDDKTKQQIRLVTLNSIDKNFINELDSTFSKYLLLEKNYEIFKKAIQITINHNKINILKDFSILLTKQQINPIEYLKMPDYYNFLYNIFLFGLDIKSYNTILTYFFPLLKSIDEKAYTFDEGKLTELYYNLDGLFSKIVFEYLPFDNSTIDLRLMLYTWTAKFSLDNTNNLLLSLETNKEMLSEYIDIIEKYYIRTSIVKGLFNAVCKNIDLSQKIINILLKLIEKNNSYDPFLTNINEKISENINFLIFANKFIQNSKMFKFIFSLNLIFRNPPDESQQIMYDLFKFILVNNSEIINKNEIFPFLLGFEKNRKVIYKLFIDKTIEINKKVAIIDLFGSPEFSESSSFLISLLSTEDNETSVKVIKTIGLMNNPENFSQLLDFVSNAYQYKEIQLQFAKSSISCMSQNIIPFLIKLTDYNDYEVKEAALTALGYLPVSQTLPILINDYIKNKKPERLYNYYSQADNELKEYWCKKLNEELKDEKFLIFIMEGIYPYKFYSFDNIILNKILNFSEKPFYLFSVINTIKKIPSSEILSSLTLTPFLFISNESYYSLKFLKLLYKLKDFETAHYAILSKNQETLNYFFSILNNFGKINYSNLFDFVQKFYGIDGLKRLIPTITKYSKSIGTKNTIEFYLKVNDVENSYKILVSLYPFKLDFNDCSRILEKNINILPIVLKLASEDIRIYKYFTNLIYENSFIFSLDVFNSTLLYCQGQIPEDLKTTLNTFLEKEKREEIIRSGLTHIITNMKDNIQIDSNTLDLIVSILKIENEKDFWYIIENCSNIKILVSILDKNSKLFNLSQFEILKRILYSKNKLSSRNLLFTFFLIDKKLFFQYLNSTNSKVLDPYMLSLILSRIDHTDSLSYNILFKSLISIKDKKIIFENNNVNSVEELIFDLYQNNYNYTSYHDDILTLNFLINKIQKRISSEQTEEKQDISFQNFLKVLALSKITQYEKIGYIDKFLEKSNIDEKSIYEILSKDEKTKDLILLLLLTSNCKNLSFATDYFIMNIDLINISENILQIILPKLDSQIIGEFILSKNLDKISLKKFIKIVPEIILLNKELSSLLKSDEITNIYFQTKNRKFLYFFLENSLISIDQIFNYAKTYEQRSNLAKDIINYLKILFISDYNFKQIIQFVPRYQYKNVISTNFINQYQYLIDLFIFNYEKYDPVESFKIFSTLINIFPDSLKLTDNKLKFNYLEKEEMTRFYCFILLSSYLYSKEKVINFITFFSLPVYEGFENIIQYNLNEFEDVFNEIDIKKTQEFDRSIFYQEIIELLLSLYQDPKLIENYLILAIKDNYEISKFFWNIVIKYRIPDLIYIFDRYYGGIIWSKTRDTYLKLFD